MKKDRFVAPLLAVTIRVPVNASAYACSWAPFSWENEQDFQNLLSKSSFWITAVHAHFSKEMRHEYEYRHLE
jgi:hypothetical protein